MSSDSSQTAIMVGQVCGPCELIGAKEKQVIPGLVLKRGVREMTGEIIPQRENSSNPHTCIGMI